MSNFLKMIFKNLCFSWFRQAVVNKFVSRVISERIDQYKTPLKMQLIPFGVKNANFPKKNLFQIDDCQFFEKSSAEKVITINTYTQPTYLS